MQKIATKIFIAASVVFGILGTVFWITMPHGSNESSDLNHLLGILVGITACVILSSFAVSIAGKYLINGDD